MKCCDIAFAISRVIEKVVVVVVVITREGSLGSGPRFDWENLREARLAAASSLRGHEKGGKEEWIWGGEGGGHTWKKNLERTERIACAL
jgi:hypothetical protein